MSTIKQPETITELRNDLLSVYTELRNKKIDVTAAKEQANLAGKVINSLKTQLVYADLRKEQPNIDFIK